MWESTATIYNKEDTPSPDVFEDIEDIEEADTPKNIKLSKGIEKMSAYVGNGTLQQLFISAGIINSDSNMGKGKLVDVIPGGDDVTIIFTTDDIPNPDTIKKIGTLVYDNPVVLLSTIRDDGDEFLTNITDFEGKYFVEIFREDVPEDVMAKILAFVEDYSTEADSQMLMYNTAEMTAFLQMLFDKSDSLDVLFPATKELEYIFCAKYTINPEWL